jgi:two-component system response regulator TctD
MARLLLIEDDQLVGELYEHALAKAGHSVQWARDAQTAVDLLDEYGAECIIMDLMLPGHNGVEVMQELQSFDDWMDIPILILSAQPAHRFQPKQLQELHVVEYLYKPENTPATVLRTIEGVLASKQTPSS